jgi:hypothetical protein
MEFLFYRIILRLAKAISMNSDQIAIRVHGLGPLDAYQVTEDELERIEKEGNELGIDFALAQFGITLASAFLANLLITPMELGKVYVIFVVIIVVGLFFGVAHGIKWYRHRGAFSALIQKIKDRQVGPVGSQGKEVSASELSQLDSSASTAPDQGDPKP